MSVGSPPGPWDAVAFPEANGTGWLIVDNRRRNLARLYYAGKSKAERNAHLMAAAPDLYEALEFAKIFIPYDYAEQFANAEAALAKARGEA